MSDPISPLTPAQISAQESNATKDSYLHRVAVAVDQATNVVTDGSPDETISSRMARWDTEDRGVKHQVGRIISEGLDLFESDHGAKAEAADRGRALIVEGIEERAEDGNTSSR